MPTVRRARVGVSFDAELASILDKHARTLRGLGVDRSEVVNAILSEFFERNGAESLRGVISKRRSKRAR